MQLKSKSMILLGGLALVLLVAGVITYFVVKENKNAVSEETQRIFAGIPDSVTYTDINGNTVSLNDYLGRIVVVTTWASWSPFSSADLTALNTLAESYPSSAVSFLAINRKETREQAQRFLQTIPGLDKFVIVIDQADYFYQSVGGYAMPETVVFAKNGEVLLHTRGLLDPAVIRQIIDAELASSN